MAMPLMVRMGEEPADQIVDDRDEGDQLAVLLHHPGLGDR